MATIQIRIDEETKNSSKKILDNLGLDMTAAIKIYLKQIVIKGGIPFPIITANGLSVKEEELILQASKDAKCGKNLSGHFESAEELIADLHG